MMDFTLTTGQLLELALHDPDIRRARAAMRQMVGAALDRSVFECIANALRDPEVAVQRRAAQTLAVLGAQAVPVLQELIACLRDPSWTFREEVVKALSEISTTDDTIRPVLVRTALQDSSPLVRLAAGQSVIKLCGNNVPDLQAALKHQHASIRRRAVQLLAQFPPGTPQVVPALLAALEDSHVKVRLSAAEGIGRHGPDAVTAIPRLVRCAFDGDARVASAAGKSVERLIALPDAACLRWLEGISKRSESTPIGWYIAAKEHPDIPAAVRAEIEAVSTRRTMWYRQLNNEQDDRHKSFVWLLGLLCERWLRHSQEEAP